MAYICYQILRENFDLNLGPPDLYSLVQLPVHTQTLLRHGCHLQDLVVCNTIWHLLTTSKLTLLFDMNMILKSNY